MVQKKALVTGCSSGIGLAICAFLLSEGWQVIGLSRRKPSGFGPDFRHMAVDLTDTLDVDAVIAKIGCVDALVHAAGLLRVGPYDRMSLSEGAQMMQLHLETAARLVQGLAPKMPKGGRIVFIGSRVANGAAGKSLYAASKSALIGFSRSIAAELIERGITVNIVAPGATDTPMLQDPGRSGSHPKKPPIGRFVLPEEIAGTVGFLLSDAAAAMTGQHLVVCGGASLPN